MSRSNITVTIVTVHGGQIKAESRVQEIYFKNEIN